MFEYFMSTYAESILMAIACVIFGLMGYAVRQLCKATLTNDTKLSVAKVAAQFVEQVWKEIHGPEKLQKALETAEALLKKKGIDFDAEEMRILIEAAVAEFNEAFKKPLEDEAAAGAVRKLDADMLAEAAELTAPDMETEPDMPEAEE